MKVVLGIDPGLTGAVAWVGLPSPDARPVLLGAVDMPTVKRKSGKSLKSFLDLPALKPVFEHPAIPAPEAVWIEDVHAMTGQGVTSMFRFGYAAGVVAGAAAMLGRPVHLISPVGWQRPLRVVGKSRDPDSGRNRAIRLFPERAGLFARKRDNGRSDAALIALHGLRQLVAR